VRWITDVLTQSILGKNFADVLIQLSISDAWRVEITEDDELDVE